MPSRATKKIKDEDLKKAVQSKAGGPLSRALVHDDVIHIIELYRLHGYFSVEVDPKTIAGRDGRSNLVFEIKEGDKLAVRRVAFAGNSAYPSNKLKGVVKSGETNVLSLFLNNDTYDAERIDTDRDLLRRFYRAHGYADVRVRSDARYDSGTKGVVVTFAIDEGPQYRFGQVDIVSNVKSVDPAALRSSLRTQAGEIYDAGAVDKTVEELALALAKSGSPFAAALPRSERLPDQRLINLVYTIVGDKRVYVERIDIHGNIKTRDEVIRREFDLVEGDAYNRALIERGERRLKQLGYFKTVKISEKPGSAPDRVVVDVALEEDKTGIFSVMGGYSGTDGLSATVTVGDANFLGTGDIAKASATVGQYTRGFDLSLTDPNALGPHVSLGGDLFGKETFASSYQSYNSTFYGAKIITAAPLTEQLGMSWSYSIYNQNLTLPSGATASLPIQQAAAAGPMWVSSLGTGMTYSTLDNPKSPTGRHARANKQRVCRARGRGQVRPDHGRRTLLSRDFRRRDRHGARARRLRLALGRPAIAAAERLLRRPAACAWVRAERLRAARRHAGREPGQYRNVYWTTTEELQAPVPFITADANLKMALFSDAGSLWATNASSAASLASLSPAQQIANSRAIRASAGASLIWDSPFGPLRVDYAYPIAKQSFDVTQRLNFSAGAF